MQEHEAQGGSQTKIITADTGQFKALVELIRSDSFAMSFQNVRQYRQALIRGAESAAAGCGKPTTYWAPSTALRKLESRHNNAACILTDGPAEFNDVALVRLSDYEALQAAMIEAKSYIDHYMYGGSAYREPAAKAIAIIDAAMQGAQP